MSHYLIDPVISVCVDAGKLRLHMWMCTYRRASHNELKVSYWLQAYCLKCFTGHVLDSPND